MSVIEDIRQAAVEFHPPPIEGRQHLAVVIPTHNEGDRLAQTVRCLLNAAPGWIGDILIVDDLSTDGSISALVPDRRVRRSGPREEFVLHGVNMLLWKMAERTGVGRARHLGGNLAIERGADTLVFMDSHIYVNPIEVYRLAELASERNGIVQAACRSWDLRHTWTRYGGRLQPNDDRLLGVGYVTQRPTDEIAPVTACIGACYALPKSAWVKMNGWLAHTGVWGFNEQLLAIKSFFCGIPLYAHRDIAAYHYFKGAGEGCGATTEEVWKSRYAVLCVCFSPETFERIWLPRLRQRYTSPALEAFLRSPELLAERDQFQAVKQRTDEEFFSAVLPGYLTEAPSPAVTTPARPLVSVMMPAYNVGPYIAQAIQSVKAQTWPNWELVIVDDASNDDTLAVAQRYAKEDPRIRVLHLPAHTNCPRACNEALALCQGEFIARLDADDWDEPTRLERSVRYLQGHPAVHAVSCLMVKHTGRAFEVARPSSYRPVGASMVARRAVYEAVKFREQLRNGSDTAWRVEAQHAGFRFGEIPEHLYHYRYARRGSVTMTRKKVVSFHKMPKSYFVKDARRPKRLRHLLRTIPDLFDYKTLLYIGANKRRCDLVPTFCLAGYEVDVVEIFDPYMAELRELNAETKWFRRIIPGNVLDLAALVDQPYDVVLWWHGPEHVEPSELPRALEQMTKVARRLAVIGAPHGRMDQGPVDGNPHQRHAWDPMPETFTALGWQASTLWTRPSPQSHLVAWKRT